MTRLGGKDMLCEVVGHALSASHATHVVSRGLRVLLAKGVLRMGNMCVMAIRFRHFSESCQSRHQHEYKEKGLASTGVRVGKRRRLSWHDCAPTMQEEMKAGTAIGFQEE